MDVDYFLSDFSDLHPLFGRFGIEPEGKIRFVPKHFFVRDQKTTLAK